MIFPYNNKHIYYETAGQGPAVLLLHGFLENASMWNPVVNLIQSRFTIVRLDLPGHGRSDVYSEIHSMEFMAEVVRDLLKSVGIDSISIVGHSMGGYVGLAYLEKYPEMVRQIVLLNSTPYADTPERKINRERALALIPENKELFISVSISNLFAEDTREEFSEEIKKLQKEANEIPTSGILAAIRGMKDRKDRAGVLKNFPGNKILICGTKDTVVPFEDSKRAATYTNSTLVSVASGHMTLIENVKESMNFVHFIE